MTALVDSVKRLLENATPAEKAELLGWIAQDIVNAFPGIERQPDVQGGSAVILRTRIAVWGLVEYRQLGVSDAELLQYYPHLTAQDLANAWAYYDAHRQEIDTEIAQNKAA